MTLLSRIFGDGIDLPTRDTLRLVWEAARSRPDIPLERAATVQMLPEMWYPFIGNFTLTQGFSAVHPGADWAMPSGTPLYATFAGQVVQVGQYSTLAGYAYRVTVAKDGVAFTYGHMQPGTFEIRVGQWVQAKEYLGRSDNTGNSTGPHLHMAVFYTGIGDYRLGGNINPLGRLNRWTKDVPPPTPPPAGNRARCWRNSPIIKKNTGKKVGLHTAGTVLAIGGTNGDWTYVDAQNGQPAGWVKTANLVRES